MLVYEKTGHLLQCFSAFYLKTVYQVTNSSA